MNSEVHPKILWRLSAIYALHLKQSENMKCMGGEYQVSHLNKVTQAQSRSTVKHINNARQIRDLSLGIYQIHDFAVLTETANLEGPPWESPVPVKKYKEVGKQSASGGGRGRKKKGSYPGCPKAGGRERSVHRRVQQASTMPLFGWGAPKVPPLPEEGGHLSISRGGGGLLGPLARGGRAPAATH